MMAQEGKPEGKLVIFQSILLVRVLMKIGLISLRVFLGINHWNNEEKLKWLKVRLTGRALMAYR